jgi:hypothetical protein
LIIAITKRRRRSFESDLLDLAGVLQLHATDVSYFLAFARALFEQRERFAHIGSHVAHPRIDDDELNELPTPRLRDLDAAVRRRSG